MSAIGCNIVFLIVQHCPRLQFPAKLQYTSQVWVRARTLARIHLCTYVYLLHKIILLIYLLDWPIIFETAI